MKRKPREYKLVSAAISKCASGMFTATVVLLTSEGKEGVMCNLADAPYECKRTRNILKVKKMQSIDLKIVGFEEGDGKYKGTLGKVIIDVCGVSVGCGSGFSDNERLDIWSNKDKYLGKWIEVQYQEKIAKTGSLRFPTVKGVRLDI